MIRLYKYFPSSTTTSSQYNTNNNNNNNNSNNASTPKSYTTSSCPICVDGIWKRRLVYRSWLLRWVSSISQALMVLMFHPDASCANPSFLAIISVIDQVQTTDCLTTSAGSIQGSCNPVQNPVTYAATKYSDSQCATETLSAPVGSDYCISGTNALQGSASYPLTHARPKSASVRVAL